MDKQKTLIALALGTLVFAATGCGKSTVAQSTGAPAAASSNTSNGSSSTSSPVNTSGVNFDPAISASYSFYGAQSTDNNWTSASIAGYSHGIPTANVLKIQLTPASAGVVSVPGNGFSAEYGCIEYSVSISDPTGISNTTRSSGPIAVNGGSNACPGAPTAALMDFSDRVNTPGLGNVTVTLSSATYDFYCQSCWNDPILYNAQVFYQFGTASACASYCPLHPLYKTHNTNGQIQIQINGTVLTH